MKIVRRQFWYPVLDSSFFQYGDVIWVETTTQPGYHEVLGTMRGAILVRPMTNAELCWRRRKGRWRRFWLKVRKRLFGTMKDG